MKKNFVSMAIAAVLAASSSQILADQYDENATTNEHDYIAVGVGAASGALIAGPAGLIVGSIVGGLFGWGSSEEAGTDMDQPDVEQQSSALVAAFDLDPDLSIVKETPEHKESEGLMLASLNSDTALVEEEQPGEINRIKQIVVNDLNVAVYFKPGSVDFESFYSQQFSVIANLLHEMPEMELNLEGYSDRQGMQSDNLQLSAERLESVRNFFVNNGIDASRINIHAYGEKNFLSTPGELDSYMFDRRVVVSFKEPSKHPQNSVATVDDKSSL